MATHYHVSHGIPGYGPDCDEGTPTFEDLASALDYARDELSTDADMVYEDANSLAESGQYEDAWKTFKHMEELELLRANLNPDRRNAPLYANDPDAYKQLQESQAAEFPIEILHNCNLYLWDCSETECEEDAA